MSFNIEKIIEESKIEAKILSKTKPQVSLLTKEKPRIYKISRWQAFKNKVENEGLLCVFIHPLLHLLFLSPLIGKYLKYLYNYLNSLRKIYL